MNSTKNIKFWCALLRTPKVGCTTFNKLLLKTTPEELFHSSNKDLRHCGLHPLSIQSLQNPDWDNVKKDLNWLSHDSHHLIKITDSQYPPLLKEITNPPPLLFINGNPESLLKPQLAIVGSRNPSITGLETAHEFSNSLSKLGFTITSGLALGIDGASHEGALSAQKETIAIMGTGLDRIYPARHHSLALKIANTGALVSEFPIGTPAKAHHFPQRNRIISGLCSGLLVIEATHRSGSLITAKMALDQNREVFAIPGSIRNPLAQGCNALIQEGAKLTTHCQDILEEFNIQPNFAENRPSQSTPPPLTMTQKTILESVQFSPTLIDAIVKHTRHPTDLILSTLLQLEILGLISAQNGFYTRIK